MLSGGVHMAKTVGIGIQSFEEVIESKERQC